MSIETLDDILVELADKLELNECPSAMEEYCTLYITERNCRLCFINKTKKRIEAVVEANIKAVFDKLGEIQA